jgi:hypothetical protein
MESNKDVVISVECFGRFEHLFDRRLNEIRGKRAAMEEGRVMEEG